MKLQTLDDVLESLEENLLLEAGSQGLGSWSINASGEDITSTLEQYSLDDLEELREEILEGQKVLLKVDLSEVFLSFIEERLEDLLEQQEEESDYDEEEY